jgi:hypothetical protein
MLTARARVRRSTRIICVAVLSVCAGHPLYAQDPPPRIGPFVVDLQGILPKFGDKADLALSRGLSQAELPGMGLGARAGMHLYLPKLLGVTVGVGGEVLIGRSHAEPPAPVAGSTTGTTTGTTTGSTSAPTLRPVTETFKSISPQLSLNFGNGNGWSYLSVGVGRSLWSIVPDGGEPEPVDEEPLQTINYGGGARWFIRPHLAFSLDVRFYDIAAGAAELGFPATPRTVLLVIGAGLSIK